MRSKWLFVWIAAVACADLERGAASAPTADANLNSNEASAGDNNNNGTDPVESLSFAEDIHGALLRDCQTCHASDGQASGTELVYQDDVNADFATTLMFIDESSPADSRLLTKASGRGHGGGATYPTTSSEYDLVLRWIAGGALP
ncbi:MAG: hypothetical protein AAFU77_07345 [Myxococcota bacterium]